MNITRLNLLRLSLSAELLSFQSRFLQKNVGDFGPFKELAN